MPQETLHSVKKTSDGNVKISLEFFQELQAKAAEKPPIIHTTVQKTTKILAEENRAWGVMLIAGGLVTTAIGAYRLAAARRQEKEIKKDKRESYIAR